MQSPPNSTLTIADVQSIAKVSRMTALRWVQGNLPRTPRLPAVRIGRQWRIQRADLDRFLQGA